MKKRTVLAFVCILLAAAIGFVLIPAYNTQQYKKVEAVVAVKDIPEGTQISGAMVQTMEVFAQSVPTETLQKADDVIGKYAVRFIGKSDYITAVKLADAPPAEKGISVKGNKMVVSVTIPSAAAGVSGALQPGDLVSVYAIPKQSEGNGSIVSSVIQAQAPASASPQATAPAIPQIPDDAILPEELRYVEVAGIYSGTAKADDKAVSIPTTVSFYVDTAQAKKLVEIEDGAALHLVLAARGDARLQYLKKEDLQLWS